VNGEGSRFRNIVLLFVAVWKLIRG